MLEVVELSVRYGVVAAVERVSLQANVGEIVALMGPNGAGKSSVLNALAGLVRPASGAVRVRGRDMAGIHAAARVRHGLALVIEGRGVFGDMTVRENLELGAYVCAAGQRAREESIHRVVEMFPRLGERMAQDAGSLSGGEQQMLVIGRALMNSPKLLLLDEPSLGLAPKVVDEIATALRRLVAEHETCVLVAEQNAAMSLDLADRGYVLHNGSIQAEGACSVLRHEHDLMALYMGQRKSPPKR